MAAQLRERIAYAAQAACAIARNPYDGTERARERLAERQDLRTALPPYEATPDWEARLHEQLGAPWPCPEAAGFDAVWRAAAALLRERGLAMGKGAFGGWDDGDPSFARAAWCLVAHLQPAKVVETGVARGLTSRCLLERMNRSGTGELWSIDLAPLIDLELSGEIGAAVDESCRLRWHFIAGTSRRVLPCLLPELGTIDVFVHDSMHTTRNLRFELDQAWSTLGPGGYVLVDDVEYNRVFGQWPYVAVAEQPLIVPHADGIGFFGIARKTLVRSAPSPAHR